MATAAALTTVGASASSKVRKTPESQIPCLCCECEQTNTCVHFIESWSDVLCIYIPFDLLHDISMFPVSVPYPHLYSYLHIDDETNSYILPEGEWYCSECTLSNLLGSERGLQQSQRRTRGGGGGEGGGGGDEETGGGGGEGEGEGGESMGPIGSDFRSPDKRLALSHLQAEYHTMRRDRNRCVRACCGLI